MSGVLADGRVGWRRSATPAVLVALVAIMLQLGAITIGPRLASDARARSASVISSLDYGRQPTLAIPALEAGFVAKRLGEQAATRVLASPPPAQAPRPEPRVALPVPTPRPATSPTPAPSPGPLPTIRPTISQVSVAMRTSKSTVVPAEEFVYSIWAKNSGTQDVLVTFRISTHTPRNTRRCAAGAATPETCIVPGDYDGQSKDPNAAHVNPQEGEATLMMRAGTEREIYSLRIFVSDTAPAGYVIRNHSHVDIVGDNLTAFTLDAPDAVVTSGFRVSR